MNKNVIIGLLLTLVLGLAVASCIIVSKESKGYEIDEINKDYVEENVEVTDEHIEEAMKQLLSVYATKDEGKVKVEAEEITSEDNNNNMDNDKDVVKSETTEESIKVDSLSSNDLMDKKDEEIYSKIPQTEKDRIFKDMNNYSIDEKVQLFKYFYDVKLELEEMFSSSDNKSKEQLTDNEIIEKVKNKGLEKLYVDIIYNYGIYSYDSKTDYSLYKPLKELAEVYLVKNAIKGQTYESTVGEYFNFNPDVENASSDVIGNVWKKSGETSRVFPDDPNGEYFGYKNHYRIAPHRFDCTCGSVYSFECNASSILKPEGNFTYNPQNLKYNSTRIEKSSRRTAWVEGVEGPGIGEWFEVKEISSSIDSDGTDIDILEEICLVNGYASNEKTFTENGRVKTLKFYFNDVEVGIINLKDTDKPQYIDVTSANLKFLDLQGAKCRFEIVDVYPGSRYDDTCVTGVMLKTIPEWYYENER